MKKLSHPCFIMNTTRIFILTLAFALFPQFLAAQCNDNVALSRDVFVSSIEADAVELYDPAHAVDGNMSTRWSSNYTDDEYLYVDLGSELAICEVIIHWEDAFAEDYDLRYYDGLNWVTLFAITGNTDLTNTFANLNITTRYIGFFGKKRATSFGYSIYEFVVNSIGGYPDYIPENLTVSDATVYAGQYIDVNVMAKNAGLWPAGINSDGKVYFSYDATLDLSDIEIGSNDIEPLAAGQATPESETVQIPGFVVLGSAYLLYKVDASNELTETDETNNVAAYPLTIIPKPLPDYIPENLSVSNSTVSPEETIALSVFAKNQGNGAGPINSKGKAYFSTDNVLDNSDIEIGLDDIEPLDPGQFTPENEAVTIPASAPLGIAYIIYKVDANNEIEESNENNNITAIQINVVGTPDLRVRQPAVSNDVLEEGETFNAQARVRNSGSAYAGISRMGYYLSVDDVFDVGDVFLGELIYPDLAAGTASPLLTKSLTIPLGTTTGIYHLIFRADYLGQVAESNENNNFAVISLTINSLEPDLVAINPGVSPANVNPGESTTASVRINNIGNKNANASKVGIYFSDNTILDAGDQFLGETNVSALGSGDFSDESLLVNIPVGTLPGIYYIIFYADYLDKVAESNEANNAAIASVFVNEPKPDLILQSPSLNPSSLHAGDNTTLTVRVNNIGDGNAASSKTGYYLSNDNILDGTDVFLAESDINPLAAGAFQDESIVLNIPAGTTPGIYYIMMWADYLNTNAESNEPNNGASVILSVNVQSPDLIGQNASINPDVLQAGDNTTASVRIRNIGNGNAIPTKVGFYLSADNSLGPLDDLLGESSVAALGPGTFQDVSKALNIPVGTAPGTYFLMIKADYLEEEAESNENNNVTSVSLTIVVHEPDLIGQNASLNPDILFPGENATISVRVRNIGNRDAIPTKVGYYLSADNNLGPLDDFLGESSIVALTAGNYEDVSKQLTIPGGTAPGTYYLMIKADHLEEEGESNENNNIISISLTIEAQEPDLIGQNASLDPDVLAAGENATVSVRVRNIGNGDAIPTKVGYYLSADNSLGPLDDLLGESSIVALNAGNYEDVSRQLTIPVGTAPGTYYLMIKADHLEEEDESNENNNVISVSFTVEAQEPDLIGQNLLLSPTTIAPEGPTTASIRIRNIGNGNAGSSKVGFYLSADNSLGPLDELLDEKEINSLNAGSFQDISQQLTIPASSPAGNYYIIAKADHETDVAESNENNNVISFAISITALQPDLIVESASLNSTSLNAGASTAVSATVSNIGNGSATLSKLGYYLSVDNSFGPSDNLLGESIVANVAAGASQVVNSNIMIPAGTSPGIYFIHFVADHAEELSEENENNNVHSETITVLSPTADLAVNNETITPANSFPDGTVLVAATVDNVGAVQSIATKVGYYFSSNTTFEQSADTYLGPDDVPLLPAGGTYNISKDLTIPATTPLGTHYILIRADDQEVMTEADEANNLVAIPVVIGAAPLPDLFFDSATLLPNTIPAGTSTLAEHLIKNPFGTADAGASKSAYYLSENLVVDPSDVFLGETSIPVIPAGTEYLGTASLQIPANTPEGSYFVLFVLDYMEEVTEQNENNNTYSVPILVGSIEKPDLDYVSANVIPNAFPAGSSTMANLHLKNTSTTIAADVSKAAYYFSTDQVIDGADVLLGESDIPPLVALGDYLTSTSLLIPSNIAPGGYFIIFKLDDEENVEENNETNNLRAVPITLTPQQDAPPPGFEFTPTNASGIFYGKAQIDGIPAVGSDWVAAFDMDGNCAGSAKLIEDNGNAFIVLTIYGDDLASTEDEGINSGESFRLQLYDASENEYLDYPENTDITLFTQWQNTNGTPIPAYGNINQVYNFRHMSQTTDNVVLSPGWNLISIDVLPSNPAIQSVFSSLTPGNLEFITGFEQGATFYDPAGPAFLNTLTHVLQGSAYWVKVTETDMLSITGDAIDPSFKKNLDPGWNLSGYMPQVSTTPELYFGNLIAQDLLVYVTGFDDGNKFFDPDGLPFLNTLTSVDNGAGYWVRVTNAVNGPQYRESGGQTYTANPNYMLLQGTSDLDAAYIGEFVEVRNEANALVGKMEIMPQGYLMTTAIYGDDPLSPSLDGMLEGEKLHFVFKGRRLEPGIGFKGERHLAQLQLNFGKLESLLVYPSPFQDQLHIQYEVQEEAATVSLQLSDMFGKVIFAEESYHVQPGTFQRDIHDLDLAEGIYMLRFEVNGQLQARKKLLLKR